LRLLADTRPINFGPCHLFLRHRSKFYLKLGEADVCYLLMDHKGVRYELLQTLQPDGWKWVAHISHTQQTTGFNTSKDLAARAARRAIEKALAAEEKREENPF
jgi:hypothetical protein